MAAAATPKLESAIADPWARVGGLPCVLTVEISVPDFKVVDLVQLAIGRIVATRWTVGLDVPLLINGELIAWSEFEIVQSKLAARLTELA